VYTCKNFKAEKYTVSYFNGVPMPVAVYADLYDKEGKFYRRAKVAETFDPARFCKEHNGSESDFPK